MATEAKQLWDKQNGLCHVNERELVARRAFCVFLATKILWRVLHSELYSAAQKQPRDVRIVSRGQLLQLWSLIYGLSAWCNTAMLVSIETKN